MAKVMAALHFVETARREIAKASRTHTKFFCDAGGHWIHGFGTTPLPSEVQVINGSTFRGCGHCGRTRKDLDIKLKSKPKFKKGDWVRLAKGPEMGFQGEVTKLRQDFRGMPLYEVRNPEPGLTHIGYNLAEEFWVEGSWDPRPTSKQRRAK